MASLSDDTMNNTLKFGKLNGTNYRTWAFNMRLYLESLDLFEHADGSAVAPNDLVKMSLPCRELSILVRRKPGLTFAWLLSLNSKFTLEIRQLRRKPGIA